MRVTQTRKLKHVLRGIYQGYVWYIVYAYCNSILYPTSRVDVDPPRLLSFAPLFPFVSNTGGANVVRVITAHDRQNIYQVYMYPPYVYNPTHLVLMIMFAREKLVPGISVDRCCSFSSEAKFQILHGAAY